MTETTFQSDVVRGLTLSQQTDGPFSETTIAPYIHNYIAKLKVIPYVVCLKKNEVSHYH